jgi:hypothetical protein
VNNVACSYRRSIPNSSTAGYVLAYVTGYMYGSAKNPILIRSATEFNKVFSSSVDSSIKLYYNSTNKTAFGNYRIICDIDLSDLTDINNNVETLR